MTKKAFPISEPVQNYPVPSVIREQRDCQEGGTRLGAKASDFDLTQDPKVSIITVVFNGERFLEEAIGSVIAQSYSNIEHIVIDGDSKDGTLQIIKKYDQDITYWISERDDGIYDAMNKGIRYATGTIVGTLNSDDYYAHENVISDVVQAFEEETVEIVFGNLRFVDPVSQRVVRRYTSHDRPEGVFRLGLMPAHPTFFVRSEHYARLGVYKTDYQIAADFELLLRFLGAHKLPYRKLHDELVVMRTGGVSTRGYKSNILLNREIIRACRENGVSTNAMLVAMKYLRKVRELF